jgi:hypothetical protein
MNRFWMKIVSSLTLVIFASTAVLAEPGAAMLYPSGAVMLNGNAIPGATALFKGDVVSTNSSSIAAFNTQNSRISITAQTTVKLEDKAVNLRSGVVTVDTTGGFVTHAANYSVAPTSTTGRYRVVRKGDAILVASLEGPVMVKWGTNAHMVAAGTNWASPSGDGSGQQGPQPMPTGKLPSDNGLSTTTLIIIGAGMAGLAAALALTGSNTHPVSPVRP